MNKLFEVAEEFSESTGSSYSSTLHSIINLINDYPNGVTPTIIASELQIKSKPSTKFKTAKVTSINQPPTVILKLDSEFEKCEMILHSKYFNFTTYLQDATIRFIDSGQRISRDISIGGETSYMPTMIPTELFILPTDDVSWLFSSLLEDVEHDNLNHNLILKVLQISTDDGGVGGSRRADLSVCDSVGAKGIMVLYGSQCELIDMFKVVCILNSNLFINC